MEPLVNKESGRSPSSRGWTAVFHLLLVIVSWLGGNNAFGQFGNSQEALESRLESAPTPADEVLANLHLAYFLLDRDTALAVQFWDAARGIVAKEILVQTPCMFALVEGRILLMRRNMISSGERLLEALQLAEERSLTEFEQRSCRHLAEFYLIEQEYDSAYSLATTLIPKIENKYFAAQMNLVAGWAALELRGKLSEGRELLGKAEVLFRQVDQ